MLAGSKRKRGRPVGASINNTKGDITSEMHSVRKDYDIMESCLKETPRRTEPPKSSVSHKLEEMKKRI